MKSTCTFLLLAVVLISGIARAETLVPPLWKDSAHMLGNDDGSQFLLMLKELPNIATMVEARDPLLTRLAAQQLVTCDILAAKHGYDVDHDGAVLIQRVRFWLLLLIGRYGDASACAKDLFLHTDEPRFGIWAAIADEKAGRDADVDAAAVTSAPDAVLGCAHFAASLGNFDTALALSLAVWKATPANSAERLDSSFLSAGIHYSFGKERSARRILFETAFELRPGDRKAYLEHICAIPWIKARPYESQIWQSLAGNTDLTGWLTKISQCKAEGDYNSATQISVVLFDMAPLSSPTASEIIDNLVLWGQRDVLDSFAQVCSSEGEQYVSLVFAYLDFFDLSSASHWLSKSLISSKNDARLCSSFLERCRLRKCDPSTVIWTVDLPVMARAYFALETGQFSLLDAIITGLRATDPEHPVLVLAPMAAAIARGSDVNISLDVLETFLSKREIQADWLRNFRYEKVITKSLLATQGEAQLLEPMIRAAVKRMAGADAKKIDAALIFSALCGGDVRFKQLVANELTAPVADAAKGELPAWYADVLYLRLSDICDEPGVFGAVKIAAGYFEQHGGLLLLLGYVSIQKQENAEAIQALNNAFIYGNGDIRAKAEALLKSLQK